MPQFSITKFKPRPEKALGILLSISQIDKRRIELLAFPLLKYSDKYFDDTYEYRHVVLPPEVAKLLPKNRLLSENEWRAIGVQQSRGWVHYAIHRPEPHIMLFRRPLNYQQQQENQAGQNMVAKG
ncbi:unnamed protein product [Fraxinus pennsylvanica]|uniref:Cyclin-dependent kinases regulatory subunit n=1 Tax=Fraxinus pennsylvanica TaxID=56036 RepID=A0AAD2DWM6_9LAMI|nr:unnamed protein product [Fraxinus pennsylvanica]